mgnify:CR=1
LNSIKKWNKRRSDLRDLEECLAANNEKCYLSSSYKKQIFYISNIKQSKLGKEVFNEKINDIQIYANKIVKK